jgi:hypothetical protein
MNHKNLTLGIATIVAAIAVTAVGFAAPQQALAYHHHHHNHDNGVKVNQDTTQINACNNNAACLNNGTNTVDIDR